MWQKIKSLLIVISFIFISSNLSADDRFNGSAVYDAIRFENKPELTEFGLQPISVIYTPTLWKGVKDEEKMPSRANVLKQVKKAARKSKIVCLDIEHWPTCGDPNVVKQSIERLSTIVGWVKADYPELMVGLYGVVPIRDYHRTLDEKRDEYKKWQEENAKLKPLADAVDVIFPSIYTFYEDEDEWVKYAEAQIKEAKRYGKPVLAFIWPYYHGSNKIRGGKPISEKYWKLQMDTLEKNDVGTIIWASGNSDVNTPNDWDENAGWWKATKQKMKE